MGARFEALDEGVGFLGFHVHSSWIQSYFCSSVKFAWITSTNPCLKAFVHPIGDSSGNNDEGEESDGGRREVMENMAKLWLEQEVKNLEGSGGKSGRGGGRRRPRGPLMLRVAPYLSHQTGLVRDYKRQCSGKFGCNSSSG